MSITVDLRDIDLASLIEQETPTRLGRAYGTGEKRTRKGTCPWCGGNDRFAVVESETPHYFCGIHGGAGCGRHGDAIKFLQEWHGIGFRDACKRLDVHPTSDGQPLSDTRHHANLHTTIERPPCEVWSNTAGYFLALCQQWLWKASGAVALDELHRRGFSDETIRANGYGYNPKTLFDKDVTRWSIEDKDVKAVWLPRGLVIPYYVNGNLWKVNIRRPASDLAEDEQRTGRKPNKYVNIKGGSNPIYHVDTIQPHQPLVILEGEFNADLLHQQVKAAGISNIAIIATGSTGKGRADNWLLKLAKASPILISFDPDNGGDKASQYWLQVLPQAVLWPSVGGDVNDMHINGKDVLKWLQRGLNVAGVSRVEQCEPSVEQVGAFVRDFCSRQGYTLRVKEDGMIAIGVPESVTDEEYDAISERVCSYGEALYTVLGGSGKKVD